MARRSYGYSSSRHSNSQWPAYVPVAVRKQQAAETLKKLEKSGQKSEPVIVHGRTIASTFWGKAWCENLERYSDFSNRLPRGRTYLRNGSVLDLQIEPGVIKAQVAGSSLYSVEIKISTLSATQWEGVKKACAGQVGSLIELLRGKLSAEVMKVITHPLDGLFPNPKEIDLDCSCPDWADMCKHVAAVLYGIGARLDSKPELLFRLRNVDHLELIATAAEASLPATGAATDGLGEGDLADVFGIEIDAGAAPVAPPPVSAKANSKPTKLVKPAKPAKPTKPAKPVKLAKAAKKSAPQEAAPPKKSPGRPRKNAVVNSAPVKPRKRSPATVAAPAAKAVAKKPKKMAKTDLDASAKLLAAIRAREVKKAKKQ